MVTSGKSSGDDFEKKLLRFEEIVSLLERGKLSLDKAVVLYEEGTKLASECFKMLKDAKLKAEKVDKFGLTKES